MNEQQTPIKLSARSVENRTGRFKDFPSKKSKKISNKISNASSGSFSEESVDFSPISEITVENLTEDVMILKNSSNASSASFSEESVDFLPISDITEENLTEEAMTFLLEETASETSLQPEKFIHTTDHSSTNCFDVCEFEMNKFTGVEDAITMSLLKNFKADVIITSDNAGLQYKKLRDEIIEYVLQDLNHNTQHEDISHTRSQSQVVSRKKPFLFLSVIIWFIGVLAVLFFTPDVDCGLVPT